jgi:integrase
MPSVQRGQVYRKPSGTWAYRFRDESGRRREIAKFKTRREAATVDALPPRIDTPLLFPAVRGGHLNLNTWRRREWDPALRAAGLEHRPPYALRHSFAAWSIAAGIGLFELARLMGTSVEQIDQTYGHLLPDSLERACAALEMFGHLADTEDGREVEHS